MSDIVPATPFARSYWVSPYRLLAGYYPGDVDAASRQRKLRALLSIGVRHFINLTSHADRDRLGRPFRGYESDLYELADSSKGPSYHHFPIVDGSVPSFASMTSLMTVLDDCLSDGTVTYLHCRGGIGRTGTVVSCFLLYHRVVELADVFDRLQELRQLDERHSLAAPETQEQRLFVAQWWAHQMEQR